MATLPGEGLLNTIASGKTLLDQKTKLTDGWYVIIGCIGSILLASTPVAPVALAIMTVAVVFQLTKLAGGQ